MNSVYLILGGNLGKRDEVILHALRKIDRQLGKILHQSGIYETDAWGFSDQPSFYNCAIVIQTIKNPQECLKTILNIEEQIGRVRSGEKWKERIIDIDMLYFNQEVIATENLHVPHPHLHERKFVLVPLNEIAPEFVHPLLHKTNQELLNDCEDTLKVKMVLEAKLLNDLISI